MVVALDSETVGDKLAVALGPVMLGLLTGAACRQILVGGGYAFEDDGAPLFQDTQ